MISKDVSQTIKKENITRGIEKLLNDQEMKQRAVKLSAKFEHGFPTSSVAALGTSFDVKAEKLELIDFVLSCMSNSYAPKMTGQTAFFFHPHSVPAKTMTAEILVVPKDGKGHLFPCLQLCNHLTSLDRETRLGSGSLTAGAVLAVVRESNYTEDEVIQWLDSKPRGSVVYVSFGSEVNPTEEEYPELAKALEESTRPFIWAGLYLIVGGIPRWKRWYVACRYWRGQLGAISTLRVGSLVAEGYPADKVTKEDIVVGLEMILEDEEIRKRSAAIRDKFEKGYPASSLDAFCDFVNNKFV
ncbi:hypothetical protein ACLB2K_045165 [Fragaria x ananassa]